MIKKLTQKDNKQVMDFLSIDPEFNIFIIGDIEQFGYESDFQNVWGEYENNELISVLLQYRKNVVYYSTRVSKDIDVFNDVLTSFEYDILNGKKEVVEVFENYLNGWSIKDMYFCSLKNFQLENIDTSQVYQLITYDDFCEEHDLLATITEFSEREERDPYAKHRADIAAKGQVTTFGLRVNSKLVSVASVVAETKVNGMIVGVATTKEHRRKGYASIVMNALCNEFLNNKGKSLCLFFDNPKAGSIYHRLGFKDIGMYRMYSNQDN